VPVKVEISTGVFLLLPAALLLLPFRWVLAFLLAITIHETGHYVALRLCKLPIFALEITPLGVTMQTCEMQGRETVLCALAGPLFALSFTVFSKIIPCTAVCILIQSLFNLLPIYPLDGGRVLRVMLRKLFSDDRKAMCCERWILCLTGIFCLYVLYQLRFGIVCTLLAGVFFVQKCLAKVDNTRYNRGKKLF